MLTNMNSNTRIQTNFAFPLERTYLGEFLSHANRFFTVLRIYFALMLVGKFLVHNEFGCAL